MNIYTHIFIFSNNVNNSLCLRLDVNLLRISIVSNCTRCVNLASSSEYFHFFHLLGYHHIWSCYDFEAHTGSNF